MDMLISQILIIGPSGCGKTTLVKYFAQLKNCGLVTIESSNIASAEPGKSEQILTSLFHEAVSRSQEQDDGEFFFFSHVNIL